MFTQKIETNEKSDAINDHLKVVAYPKAPNGSRWILHTSAQVYAENTNSEEQLAQLKNAGANILAREQHCSAEDIRWNVHDDVWVGKSLQQPDYTVQIVKSA